MTKAIIAAALLLAAIPAYSQIAPSIRYEIESDLQQTQELVDQRFQQGGNVEMRISIKSSGRWLNLAGLTASWYGQETATSTQRLEHASAATVTDVTPNYFRIRLDSGATGTERDGWQYSIVVTETSTEASFPLGIGALDIDPSTYSGPAAVLVTPTVEAYLEARLDGIEDEITSNVVANLTWTDISGKPFEELSELNTNNLTGVVWTDFVTGEPWTLEGYIETETDPVWESEKAGYATTGALAVVEGVASTAWQNPPNATNFTFTTNASLTEITLASWLGTGGDDVVIPDYIDGLPVTVIGTNAFAESTVTSVSGGANVRSIGGSAFGDCTNLESVSLPSATSIGEYAFFLCTNLESVSLPAATNLGIGAFASCSSITSITLPAATSIGEYAFDECASLTSISLPSATSIGANAFGYSTSLTNVTFSAATAPTNNSTTIFEESPNVIVYVTNPTATGWGDTFGERPVVRLPVTAAAYALPSNRYAIDMTPTALTNATHTISYIDGPWQNYTYEAATNAITITVTPPPAGYGANWTAYWASGFDQRDTTFTNSSGGLRFINDDIPTTSEAQIFFTATGTNIVAINVTVTQ